MRAFFALEVPPALQCAIGRWRDRAALQSAARGRAVAAANFHLTLAFLGELAPRQIDDVCAAADRIAAPRLTLRLDRFGCFARAGILWIGPSETPEELADLAARLNRAARRVGIRVARKSRISFTPHLTLLRDWRGSTLHAAPPDFELHCDGFALFESQRAADGARYRLLRRWSCE